MGEAELITETWAFAGLIIALQIKHLLADYCLQSQGMIQNRRLYGHRDGLAHVAVHGIGSLCAFLLFGSITAIVLAIILAEMLIHYHIDWAKDNLVDRLELRPDRRAYWVAAGTDQALHQATYIAMAIVWFVAP